MAQIEKYVRGMVNLVPNHRPAPNNDGRYEHPLYIPEGHAYLPHSCDEWIIGDLNAVNELIEDLEAVRFIMEGWEIGL